MIQRTIDIDRVSAVALKGVRRASAFLGLGVNVSRDPEFSKYQLNDFISLRVIPDDLGGDEVAKMKDAFEVWIIVNGLRELVETFALFLDRIHTSCLLMATSKQALDPDDANTFGPAFERKGIERKLATLRNRFDIGTDKETYLASINRARNCITHRNGIVGAEDVGDDDVFRLKWWALDFYIETPDGEKIHLKPPYPENGIYLEDGGTVMMKITDRAVEYSVGDYIRLSPSDLSEICLLFQLSTTEIVKSTIEYAKGIGIDVRVNQNSVEQDAPAPTLGDKDL